MGAKRRIDVMLSSTFLDLVEHRDAVIAAMNGLQLTPLAQEFDAATDSDLIKESLERVERADVYVGIIGVRYGQRPICPIRNPDRLSLTELEYRRAVERQLPRLMFVSGPEHLWPQFYVELSKAEGDEGLRLQQAFVALVRNDRITGEFTSPDHLKAQANTSFVAVQKKLELADVQSVTVSTAPKLPPSPDDFLPPAPPAFHYVRKPYVEKQGFAGRGTELALIDQWIKGPDGMLLFQAIGGMGKSMLTWHWLRTRAAVRDDWAGQLWYSFYEQGADLNDFCVNALAYVHHEPPKTFRGRRTLDLGDELRRELDMRPWLLILDGLERVLVAYNRAGKEHMTDEEAVVARDGMGLDREPRGCFRPEDDDVLAMLAQAAKGKLLASSRLTPTALTNAARQPIPGVLRVSLNGLAPEDAEQVLRNTGVRGDGWRMRRFLADNFDSHPLSVGVVAGQVMTFLEARGDFDHWVEHPKGGADPALIAKDLRGRQNHILSRAFDDLDDDEKALLGSIAMASMELTPDVLHILNPMRPIEPTKVDPPREVRAAAHEKFDANWKENFAKQKDRYESYVAAHTAWQSKAGDADAWLAQTLPGLEARGLLQYDADAGSLDMHPAIRHTALLGLSPDARGKTGSHVSDALSLRSVKPFENARTRDDLALAVTRVQALHVAGKLAEGAGLFTGSNLHDTLFRLEYFHELLELMQPYFPQGWGESPIVLPQEERLVLLHLAAIALKRTGQLQPASKLYDSIIKLGLTSGEVDSIPTLMNNLALCLKAQGQAALAARLLTLAIRLAEATGDMNDLALININRAEFNITRGDLTEAQILLNVLSEEITKEGVTPFDNALFLGTEVHCAFRAGHLTEVFAAERLNRIRSLGVRVAERDGLANIALWRKANGNHNGALDAFSDAIILANEVGSSDLQYYEALRAHSLAALGRREEAARIAARVDRGTNPPHVSLALLYLELGDHAHARAHALAGYRNAWGEGPPYHDHWDLEDCRKVLAAVGEPEPVLPPFDPSKLQPFDFEPDVERLIEKIFSEKAKEAEEKAQRGAGR